MTKVEIVQVQQYESDTVRKVMLLVFTAFHASCIAGTA
jgi:hypothetical protein